MRSLLFVPGDQDRKLAKALTFGADALILDLEDSVAPDRKPAARAETRSFLQSAARLAGETRLVVRINALSTGLWRDDLAAVMPARPHAILLPKPRSGSDVAALATALTEQEREHGLPSGETKILALPTEVPGSLLLLATFAGASERLAGLAWGAEDLSAALGASAVHDETGALASPFRLARDLCLFAAAAAGCAAIDGVCLDLDQPKRLEKEAREAARDGFSSKLAIHPAQVAAINAAFTPSPGEVAEARAILAAFAAHPGAGVVAHDGRMLDRPHLLRAERLLARAALAEGRKPVPE
ncbi:MAG: HpcH/HpaI aldolase/citrate lyase family protein [Hyphomicrobium sp.]